MWKIGLLKRIWRFSYGESRFEHAENTCGISKNKPSNETRWFTFEGLFTWRRHPESNWGMKVLQTSALPLGYGAREKSDTKAFRVRHGADYGARTRHLDLGKVALYQMS